MITTLFIYLYLSNIIAVFIYNLIMSPDVLCKILHKVRVKLVRSPPVGVGMAGLVNVKVTLRRKHV